LTCGFLYPAFNAAHFQFSATFFSVSKIFFCLITPFSLSFSQLIVYNTNFCVFEIN